MNTDTAGIKRGRFDHALQLHVVEPPDIIVLRCDVDIAKVLEMAEDEAVRWTAKKMRKLGIPISKNGMVQAGTLTWIDMSDMNVRRFVWAGTEKELRK